MKYAIDPHRGSGNATETEPKEALYDVELKRKRDERDREARRRLENTLIPGLPVDSDVVATRVPVQRVGGMFDPIIHRLVAVKEPFFDTVCAHWAELEPDLPGACPGRMQDGRIFFYVATSGRLFALRSKLPKLRRRLAALPDAPKRFTVHLEVHGATA